MQSTQQIPSDQLAQKWMEAGTVFTPGSPVNERDLFAGRVTQLIKIMQAISQRGYHAVLFGERGVGKTSLSNMLVAQTLAMQPKPLVAKINCDAGDTYSTIWHKALGEIHYNQQAPGIGFIPSAKTSSVPVASTLPAVVNPDDVRRVLTSLAIQAPVLIILDEYDRIVDRQVAVLVSDTIKALSDFGVDASILIIGVAESIDELIEGHLSIERALVQIPMPRMSAEEIGQILDRGAGRLGMVLDGMTKNHLVNLAQGLPYVAHLLGLHSTRAAIGRMSTTIDRQDADAGIHEALDQWQQSIKSSYNDAINSPQPGNIYREVLLACALAETDELGYFTAAAVRTPLRQITGRELDIPNFARHLKEFSQPGRGEIINRVGTARRLRYRFVSPIMRPYIIMRGYAEKLLK